MPVTVERNALGIPSVTDANGVEIPDGALRRRLIQIADDLVAHVEAQDKLVVGRIEQLHVAPPISLTGRELVADCEDCEETHKARLCETYARRQANIPRAPVEKLRTAIAQLNAIAGSIAYEQSRLVAVAQDLEDLI